MFSPKEEVIGISERFSETGEDDVVIVTRENFDDIVMTEGKVGSLVYMT